MIPVLPIMAGGIALLAKKALTEERKKNIRKARDEMNLLNCTIRDTSELLEAIKKEFDEDECYDEVERVYEKQSIRELEEEIEAAKKRKTYLEELMAREQKVLGL